MASLRGFLRGGTADVSQPAAIGRAFRIAVALISLAVVLQLRGAEWQWSVPMGNGRAFLWIPPTCERVRAVVVAQNNMLEEGILEHATMRRTLAELGIAAVFIAPAFDNVFRFDQGAGGRFEHMLGALAERSGYAEIAAAPIVAIGHSACASYPWNLGAWMPGRTLAIVSLKGDAPLTNLTGSGKPNPDWGSRRIDGIPALMVMSEYEWWEDRLAPVFAFRQKHPAAPIAVLCDAGRGHFDAGDELVEFLARFIRRAAEARLPRDPSSPTLRDVDPAAGWLADRWHRDAPPRVPAAPAAEYRGDRAEAWWCFDRETADATEAIHARSRGRKPQQVAFIQDGTFVPISTSHVGVNLRFQPLADGLTFKLSAAPIVPIPPKPPVAAKDKPPPPRLIEPVAAPPGRHAAGPVRISRITGPVVQLDHETFRVACNRASALGGLWGGDIWLYAWLAGDADYKPAVQQAVMKLPRHTEGVPQRISFPEIATQKLGTATLTLRAESDAPNAPVQYYVREGPAEIDGCELRFTAVPPRAKWPIAITVVAWQLGRGAEPKLQAAAPVERTFLLTP